MSNFIYLYLDTTAPANPQIVIDGGANVTTELLVDLEISVADSDTTGYQMKIWGDVDTTYDLNIGTTEEESQWVTYNQSPQIRLSSSDGSKTLNLRVRDDVHNPSTIAIDSINLDTSIPTVTVTQPDVDKISKQAGKDVASFTFQVDEDYTEYKVKLVGSISSTEETGTLIPTTNGSQNTSGDGAFSESSPITVTINARDLELAGATSDGQKIIKVFVKDTSGLWSV